MSIIMSYIRDEFNVISNLKSRKMKKSILLTCVIASMLLPGCQEDEGRAFPAPDVLGDSLIVTGDGALKFLSATSYFRIVDTLTLWHDPELDRWEETIGFTSMRKVVNRLVEESETMKTLEEKSALVDRYPHLLKLHGRKLTPSLPVVWTVDPLIPAYRTIINEQGYFYVLDTKYVVTATHLNIFEPGNTSDTPDFSILYILESGSNVIPVDQE
jgi:hypothetical protein